MAKNINYEKDLADSRAWLQTDWRRLIPDVSEETYINHRYLLYIYGVVPWFEPIRSTVAACRNSLRRFLRRSLFNRLDYSAQNIPWIEWTARVNATLTPLIRELEDSGVVQYRPVDQIVQNNQSQIIHS